MHESLYSLGHIRAAEPTNCAGYPRDAFRDVNRACTAWLKRHGLLDNVHTVASAQEARIGEARQRRK